MTHDAFSAGVEPGGLYSSKDIRILICYMPVSYTHLDVYKRQRMHNFYG